MESFTRTSTNTPIGSLASYTVTQSAIPRDPRDTSGQIPTFTATVTDTLGDYKTLIGETVTLEDWTGTSLDGTVAQSVKAADAGHAVLDSTSAFGKLNTIQTTFPIVVDETYYNPAEAAMRHWLLKCGIPEFHIDGVLLHWIAKSKWSPSDWTGGGPVPTYDLSSWGYAANSIPQWGWNTIDTDLSGQYVPTSGTYMNPLEVNLSQGIVLGGGFDPANTSAEFRISSNVASAVTNVVHTLRRSGSTWSLVERIGSGGETTLASASWTHTQASLSWVFCQIKANASDTTKIDVMFRFMEQDPVSLQAYSTDSTVTAGVVSLLRNRPRPFQMNRLNLGYGFVAKQATLQSVYPSAQIVVKLADGSTSRYKPQKRTTYTPGFTGNVWDKIREYCAIFDIDVALRNGQITFTDKDALEYDGTNYLPLAPLPKAAMVETVNNRTSAKYVQVDWDPMVVDSFGVNNNLIWKADTVYSINQGETQIQTIQTTSSFASIQQPVMVTGVPVPYTLNTGAYVITGNDGYIVDPQWWADNGGSVKVEPTNNSGEIKITIQAPTVDTTRAPYRMSEGIADRPALYIRGQGLAATKVPPSMVSATGAANPATDIGATFKSPFVTSKLIAMNVCAKLAVVFGSSESYSTLVVPRPEYTPQADKTPLGHSFYFNGTVYRITQQTVEPAMITVNKADRNNTLRIINGEYWTGKTIAQWNAIFGGKKLNTVNVAPLPHYEG